MKVAPSLTTSLCSHDASPRLFVQDRIAFTCSGWADCNSSKSRIIAVQRQDKGEHCLRWVVAADEASKASSAATTSPGSHQLTYICCLGNLNAWHFSAPCPHSRYMTVTVVQASILTHHGVSQVSAPTDYHFASPLTAQSLRLVLCVQIW